MSAEQITEPGIYDGLSLAEYLAIPAVHRTELLWLMRSPEFFAWKRKHGGEKDTSPAMGFGSAVDDLCFTPDEFEKRYAVCAEPIYNKTTNAETLAQRRAEGNLAIPEGALGKEAWDEFKRTNAGKFLFDHEQGEALYAIHSRINSSPVFKAMRAAADAKVQQTLVWNDPETGVLCKVRPDSWYTAHEPDGEFDYRLVFDLKTTYDSEPHAFIKQAVRPEHRYHVQGAMILDAMDALMGEDPRARFALLPWEKEPPFLGETIFLSYDAIETGRTEYRKALRVFKVCEERGLWPDTSGVIHTMSLPGYYQPYDGERHYVSQSITLAEVIDRARRGIDPF